MVHINFLVVVLTALIPSIVGFIWYHPKVMGTAWMKESGVNPDDPHSRSMAVTFGVSILLSVLLAGSMLPITIHQMGLTSMLMGEPSLTDPNSELSKTLAGLLEKYGQNFRTFKHGALHGFMTSIFLMLPILGTNALFERRSWAYIAVNAAYWAVTLTIMGGIICAFA